MSNAPAESGNTMRATLGWPFRIIGFVAWYLLDWFRHSIRVSAVILSRRVVISPGIVRVPMHARTDTEVTLLASLISITPATLTLSIDRTNHALHVHGMFVKDRESFTRDIEDLELRFLHALRRVPDAPVRHDLTEGGAGS